MDGVKKSGVSDTTFDPSLRLIFKFHENTAISIDNARPEGPDIRVSHVVARRVRDCICCDISVLLPLPGSALPR